MAGSDMIVLYDLARKEKDVCWSPNVWKARMMLNYKRLPYRTIWVEFKDVKSTVSALGVEPNMGGMNGEYTVPAVTFSDGTSVMDSKKIAQELEKRYPSDSPIPIETPQLSMLENAITKSVGAIIPLVIRVIARKIMTETSLEAYKDMWRTRWGMDVDQVMNMPVEEQEKCWEQARPAWKTFGEIVREDKSGPFVMGKTLSFVDFALASMTLFLRDLDESFYERVVGIEPALGEHFEAVKALGVLGEFD